ERRWWTSTRRSRPARMASTRGRTRSGYPHIQRRKESSNRLAATRGQVGPRLPPKPHTPAERPPDAREPRKVEEDDGVHPAEARIVGVTPEGVAVQDPPVLGDRRVQRVAKLVGRSRQPVGRPVQQV